MTAPSSVPALADHVKLILAHHEDDPIGAGMHIANCSQETGLSIKQLAHLAGTDTRIIQSCARLAALPADVKGLVRTGALNLEAAHLLANRIHRHDIDAAAASRLAHGAASGHWTLEECRNKFR